MQVSHFYFLSTFWAENLSTFLNCCIYSTKYKDRMFKVYVNQVTAISVDNLNINHLWTMHKLNPNP